MPFDFLNTEIDVVESITRFMFDDSHFAATKARVKPKAWEPALNNQTSVFRIMDLSESEIWALGREYVEPARGRPILARADIPVRTVKGIGLRVERVEPPPRHANIVDWPAEKPAKMSLAQQLAAESKFERLP